MAGNDFVLILGGKHGIITRVGIKKLNKIWDERSEKVDAILNNLLQNHPDLLWAAVIASYLDDEINLGKAAELLGLHELELRDRFIRLGIPLRIGPANFAEAQAEVDAVRAWFAQENKNEQSGTHQISS